MTLPAFDPVPFLPHAAPFRLLDRVVHVDLARGLLVGVRQLTASDALWPAEAATGLAQSPRLAAFPEVLIIEALCQTAACLNTLELAEKSPAPRTSDASFEQGRHHGYLVAISDFRFPGRAFIGDTLTLTVERQTSLGAVLAFAVRAEIAGVMIGHGRLLFALSSK